MVKYKVATYIGEKSTGRFGPFERKQDARTFAVQHANKHGGEWNFFSWKRPDGEIAIEHNLIFGEEYMAAVIPAQEEKGEE